MLITTNARKRNYLSYTLKPSTLLCCLFLLLFTSVFSQTTVDVPCTGAINPNSGRIYYSSSYTRSFGYLQHGMSQEYRGWARFNIESYIPSNATVTAAEVIFWVETSSGSAGNNYLRFFTGNPGTMTAAQVWTAIGQTSAHGATTPDLNPTGQKTIAMNAAGVTFLNTNKTVPVNLGFSRGTGNFGFRIYGSDGAAQGTAVAARRPVLRITYTIPCTTPAAPVALSNIAAGPIASVNGTALLPDANITANSCYAGCAGGGHEAYRGRLFNAGAGTLAWASNNNNLNNTEYLQFDLGSIQQVKGVATQGRGDCCAQLVTSYIVQHSTDGSAWTSAGTFTGNTDQNTLVTNTFTPVSARYVRIYPQGISGHMSMRADVIVEPCLGGTVSMSAQIPADANTIRWYDVATGGTALATGQFYTTGALSSNKVYYAEAYNSTTGCASATRTAVTATVASAVTLDGITVSSNCWFTDNANDYTITAKATGLTPSGIGGNTYGMLALINLQGGNTPNYGGYFAWNTSTALLDAQGYTKNQMACTGGGFVGMHASSHGFDKATLISASTTVTGNQRTVNFVVRPAASFPQHTNNSISQYAMSSNGCAAGWTENANLFSSTPPFTMGTLTVNGNSTVSDLVEVCPGQTINVSQSGFNDQGGVTYFYSDNTTGYGGWCVAPDWEIMSYGGITTANQVAAQTNVNDLASFKYKINTAGTYILHSNTNYGSCYGAGANRYIIVTSPTAPTTITPATLAVCSGSPAAMTASGGTTGSDDVYIWQAGACNIAYEQNWKDMAFSTPNTTVNAVNGILTVTSTTNDPMIDMSGLGSFAPATYRYINIRYRVTAGTAGNTEIFFYNTAHPGAVGGETGFGALISDGAWHILSIDMHQDPQYTTGGNITGWRYDWCTANGVTMDIDFISLDQFPIVAEGASYTPSPTTATTYYASKRSDCGATSCISRAVTITPNPSASITSSSSSICHGNTFSLGGNVTATGSWTLNLSDGSSVTGSGSGTWSKSVAPTSNTTYTLTSMTGASCASQASLTGSTALTLPTIGNNISGTSTATCAVKENNWVHFYNGSGLLIGAVHSGGLDLGNVTMSVNVGSAGSMFACNTGNDPLYQTAYMGRNWIIKSSNYNGTDFPALSSVKVRLPFTPNELIAMNTVATTTTTGNPNDNATVTSSLMLTKFTATNTANEDNSPLNNCSVPGVIRGIAQTGNNAIVSSYPALTSATGRYVEFTVGQFSEMFLNSNGSNSALPVTLTSFSAHCMEGNVSVNWETASEHNSLKFVLQKSRNLTDWIFASEHAAAGNSSQNIEYEALDQNPIGGTSYYRLVQVDNDGVEQLYGPISVSCTGSENSMSVFPNPSSGSFAVEISSSEDLGNVAIQLVNIAGKVVSSKTVHITEGTKQVLYDNLGLEMGTYIVQVISDSRIKPVKVVLNR